MTLKLKVHFDNMAFIWLEILWVLFMYTVTHAWTILSGNIKLFIRYKDCKPWNFVLYVFEVLWTIYNFVELHFSWPAINLSMAHQHKINRRQIQVCTHTHINSLVSGDTCPTVLLVHRCNCQHNMNSGLFKCSIKVSENIRISNVLYSIDRT